jgi:hypothetical protein
VQLSDFQSGNIEHMRSACIVLNPFIVKTCQTTLS